MLQEAQRFTEPGSSYISGKFRVSGADEEEDEVAEEEDDETDKEEEVTESTFGGDGVRALTSTTFILDGEIDDSVESTVGIETALSRVAAAPE